MLSNSGVVIANGASLSGSIDLATQVPYAIVMPASWTAANLTFQGAAATGDAGAAGTFNNLYDDQGSEVTVVAAASRHISIDPAIFAGIRYLKVRSGTSGTAVTQGGARTVLIVVRED